MICDRFLIGFLLLENIRYGEKIKKNIVCEFSHVVKMVAIGKWFWARCTTSACAAAVAVAAVVDVKPLYYLM